MTTTIKIEQARTTASRDAYAFAPRRTGLGPLQGEYDSTFRFSSVEANRRRCIAQRVKRSGRDVR